MLAISISPVVPKAYQATPPAIVNSFITILAVGAAGAVSFSSVFLASAVFSLAPFREVAG